MAKIYVYRHQAEGYLARQPFAHPPTDAQKKALDDLMFQRHGAHHPKEAAKPEGHRKRYFSRVEEFELLEPSSVIAVPAALQSVENRADLPSQVVSGSVKVGK